MPVPNQEMWKKICYEFWEKWQFSMCIGAMDGKHVYFQAPPNAGSMWYNYKDSNSIVLLALCDANYKYIIVDVGAYGKQSDGGVFSESSFRKVIIAGNADLPPASKIPGTSIAVTPVIVANKAFLQLKNLMRPFPKKDIKEDQTIFNRRLSRARRISENVFGICCAKWRAILDSLYMHPDNAETVVKSICALHNYIRVEEAVMEPER
ncbi:uncharacterized protein LOC128651510 [Bombina bombina]|uniref:uncharacterized protein LOC128651510 n=1 Tax=Bombina bombina TaxID=8345 RepID=UPI00235A8B57|nr:uncharacterized protein LOC128651510 [Bombina bombina]